MAQPPPTIVLELDAAGEAVAGRLRVAGAAGRPFSGWLELFGALRSTVAGLESPHPDAPTGREEE